MTHASNHIAHLLPDVPPEHEPSGASRRCLHIARLTDGRATAVAASD